jgi:hypothetical protein
MEISPMDDLRVRAFCWLPDADALGLPADDPMFADGVGLLLCSASDGRSRATRAGSAADLLKLTLGGFTDALTALRAFPFIAAGTPAEWPTSDSARWVRNLVEVDELTIHPNGYTIRPEAA